MPRGIPSANKHQKLVRLHPEQIQKLEAKLQLDNITYQKLSELLIKAYLKDNKEIMRIVKKYVEEKGGSKRKQALDELEKDELYRILEENYSPMKDIQEAVEEFSNEE
jgi:hypothetical protein